MEVVVTMVVVIVEIMVMLRMVVVMTEILVNGGCGKDCGDRGSGKMAIKVTDIGGGVDIGNYSGGGGGC